MAAFEAHSIKRYLGIIILITVAVGAYFTFSSKKEKDKIITYSTSDARNLKGQLTIALDSWIGYFPFRSPVFGKLMRDNGYRIKIIDDKANYQERMQMLKKGKIDFAVCTVDSYLLNGSSVNFPGTIVTIIDESKGGDAIVSWKQKFSNIDQLKTAVDFKIAFTPASPSEHLLKSIAVHFGVSRLGRKDDTWRIEVEGAEEAYKKLISKEADLAVLWEPHVTEALSNPDIIKLIGSEDIEKLIVDILIVNRNFADKKPKLVGLFLKNYFETLNMYSTSPTQLTKDIIEHTKLTGKQVKYMLMGVKWLNYPDNLRWFGLASTALHKQPEIVDSIKSTVSILIGSCDFQSDPLPDNDPYTIMNSSFIKELYDTASISENRSVDSLARRFSKLSDIQWNSLKVIGALKLRPISFRSGTSKLDNNGLNQIKRIAINIRHYPNFRILIKGHTGSRGSPEANNKLSLKRANAVKKELSYSFNVDSNRIRVLGMGSKEPLSRQDDESDRSYNNRLKRVEILFLSGK